MVGLVLLILGATQVPQNQSPENTSPVTTQESNNIDETKQVPATTTEERELHQIDAEPDKLLSRNNTGQQSRTYKGYVSTYTATYGGCLGCKKYYDEKGQLYFTMANGERLNDSRLTIAFYDLNLIPLNSMVSVCNTTNAHCTGAKVTDTGGFMACCKRIADLSLATANAIGAVTDKSIIEIRTKPE